MAFGTWGYFFQGTGWFHSISNATTYLPSDIPQQFPFPYVIHPV
jgi:hypothetical protein